MLTTNLPTPGLTDESITESREKHGRNSLTVKAPSQLLTTMKEVVAEPMFLLLLAASAVYIGLGRTEEAITLSIALLLVSGISVYQSIRSDRALSTLRELTQPQAQVQRNGTLINVPIETIVVGDVLLVEEGERVSADGTISEASDFSVDESILTGESVSVTKTPGDPVFAGTTATTGSAWLTVTAVGGQTELGKIGRSIATIPTEKTPLQRQINQFVIRMAWIGALAFVLVWGVNYARSGDWVTALLFGLTLAMSILPEEIPVAFSSFMALGAARLSRAGVLTKQPQTVESLGSATVICTDKTGTITQDGMSVRQLYDGATNTLVSLPDQSRPDQSRPDRARPDVMPDTTNLVLEYARWASENEPFDSMEKAIVMAFSRVLDKADSSEAVPLYPMVHEYP